LATPVKINSIIFNYLKPDKTIFRKIKGYLKQLQFIKEFTKRNEFIVNLSCKLKNSGNTLVLFQHTEHGKTLFYNVMKKLYPNVEVLNKNITGKKSFDFQSKHGVYFLNGQDDAKTRELTRQILERQYYDIILENGKTISLLECDDVLLTDGSIKQVQNLTLDDEIDDNSLK
jgi:hypothetical protein